MRSFAVIFAMVAVFGQAPAAHAHASLVRSEPGDRAVLAQPPAKLTLLFNEPVAPLALRLVQPSGEIINLEKSEAKGASIDVTLPSALGRGTHLLSWRVISADGHPVGGAFTFSVGEPSTAAPAFRKVPDPALRAAIWFARVWVYLGLLIGVGGAFYRAWFASPGPSVWTRTLTNIVLMVGLGAALVSIALQGLDVLELPLSQVFEIAVWRRGFSTSYAWTLCVGSGAMLLGLAGTSFGKQLDRALSSVALFAVGLAFAASGHAATASPEWVTRPAVFLHAVSVAFWVGALPPLVAALHAPSGRGELARFSKAIPIPLFVVIASGVLLATLQLERAQALWETNYGLILLAKLLAVSLLLALAATNRSATPRAIAGANKWLARMRIMIRAEVTFVAMILGLVALWRFTPPPRSLYAAAARTIHVHMHGGRAMADLAVEANMQGGRQVTIRLLDSALNPLIAKEVKLELSRADAGIEPLRLSATYVEGATWRVDNIAMPPGGRWTARLEILVSDFEKIELDGEIDADAFPHDSRKAGHADARAFGAEVCARPARDGSSIRSSTRPICAPS